MGYILVTADFPGVTAAQREKIYSCLAKENWNKVTEPGRDIDTVWWASFASEVTEAGAKKVTKEEFEACSKPYCTPKLAVHFGANAPTFYNLD